MRVRQYPAFLILVLLLLGFAELAIGQSTKRRRVYLEISADARAMVGTQQKWMEMLQAAGADQVVAKTSKTGVPTVEETELASSTIVRVTGFIVGNKLVLPGGKFTINDRAGIRSLLQKLRDDGAKVALAEKKAFGLTSEQLVGLHQRFARKVEFSTQDQVVGDVVNRLIRQSGMSFTMDRRSRAAIAGNEKVLEELEGMSTGMALAAIVRPLGIVIEPKREQGQALEIHLLDSRASDESWPIGWPIDRPPVAVAPDLFGKIPVEIRNFPLKSVLDAIQRKSGIPFYYDHNSLAREGIELQDVKVTLENKRIALLVAVSRLLRQTEPPLSYEVRVDENSKPFLWISAR